MKVWIFWSAFLVCLQVSDQIHRGELILHWHLKMRSFVCLAECNGASAFLVRPSDAKEQFEKFVQTLERVCTGDRQENN